MKTLKFYFLLTMLLVSALSCQISGGDTQTSPTVPILTEEALALSEKLEQAVQEANQQGTFTIEITEQQLTSYVALNLDKINQVPVTDVQIRLRDEQIWITGVVHQDNLDFPLELVAKIIVDSTNHLSIAFTKAQVGPFTLPKIMLDTIRERVEKVIAEQLPSVREEYVIDEISIGEGFILIRGSKK